jgi:N6-L-threonylcarbamoyladenine synthase
MYILGIETSADETSAAIVKDGTEIISNTISSSLDIQKKYGGIVPEVASRKQAEYMIPVLTETFGKSGLSPDKINAIAVTVGPGLMGSLLVGLETAKTLSYVWNKPLLPMNHMVGHVYSAWLDESYSTDPEFPLIALIASGAHTDLIYAKGHGEFELLGMTKDDAAGEAYDKVARLLNFPYPGGPEIERAAEAGDPARFKFPRPLVNSSDAYFSFSGLKTSVLYKVRELPTLTEQDVADIAAGFEAAVIEVLVKKTIAVAQHLKVRSVLVTGGVAANQHLKSSFSQAVSHELPGVKLYIPPLQLATDNASYIAAAAYLNYDKVVLNPDTDLEKILALQPNPSLESTQL